MKSGSGPQKASRNEILTLFADEAVIPVIGVVGVPQPAIRVFELEELMPMLPGVSGTVSYSERKRRRTKSMSASHERHSTEGWAAPSRTHAYALVSVWAIPSQIYSSQSRAT